MIRHHKSLGPHKIIIEISRGGGGLAFGCIPGALRIFHACGSSLYLYVKGP